MAVLFAETKQSIIVTAISISILLMLSAIIPSINTADVLILLQPEDNSKYVMNQWYYDSELKSNVGLVVSRIIVENETAHSIEGYLADSRGTRLDMVHEGVQVVMSKYVFNNTVSTKWRMSGWVNDGYFVIEKPENRTDLHAIRIHINSIDYVLDDEALPNRLKSNIFINPAWSEFIVTNRAPSYSFASQDGIESKYPVATSNQNIYSPDSYDPKHCSYLSDLLDAYLHCTKLYTKKIKDENVRSVSNDDNDRKDKDRKRQREASPALSNSSGVEQQLPSFIRVGNLTLLDVQDQTIEANALGGANFSYPHILANDTLQGDISNLVACTPESGSFFAINNTEIVSCSITNSTNETATDTFQVTVSDTSAPSMDPIENVIVEGNITGGAFVIFPIPNSTDLAEGQVDTRCEPASGSFFALGTTTVACIASDASENKVTGSFNVTVIDTTGPVLHVPTEELEYQAFDVNGTMVRLNANATDLVDIAPSVVCKNTAGDPIMLDQLYPVGLTEVVCQAIDKFGNISEPKSFAVRVVSTENH